MAEEVEKNEANLKPKRDDDDAKDSNYDINISTDHSSNLDDYDDDQEDDDDINVMESRMKKQLSKMEQSDPDFHKFLKEKMKNHY